MEKVQMLKELGFSDTFLKSLEEYEKQASTINISENMFHGNIHFSNFDNAGDFLVTKKTADVTTFTVR